MSLQVPGRVRFKLDGLTIWVTRMYLMGIRSTSSSLNLTYLALVSFILFSFFLMCLSKQLIYSCVRKKNYAHTTLQTGKLGQTWYKIWPVISTDWPLFQNIYSTAKHWFSGKVEMQNQLRSKEHSGGEERRGCRKKTSKIWRR